MNNQNNQDIAKHFQQIYRRADRIIEVGLSIYFLFGLGIAWFYETWFIALTVGPLSVGMYAVAKWFFPQKTLNQYMAGVAFALFMAQFIYQMHGLFEMHFFAFIGSILLIIYQNWKAFIPLTVLIVLHHAAFAYLQFVGYEEVYFTQLDYMSLSTFLFHVGLAAVIIGLCAYWAFDFRKHTEKALIDSLRIQRQLTHSKQNIAFAAEIARGNLTVAKSKEESDELGCSLIEMQEKLKEAQEREKREKFMNIGLAEVSDILRKNVHSLQDLSDKVLAYLVKYLKANQGALFIADDSETGNEQLTMTACYAYDKKKFLEKTIRPGQGLVGQTYLEKKTTYLKEVPQNYVTVTSGLGEATPGHLLIVPLIVNENIEGVLEVASFQEFSNDAIEFLERVGESIASMATSSKASTRTTRLLEASKASEEELRATEEEMRQNNEELQAIQEELGRKEREQSSLFQAVQQSVGITELDTEGNITKINDKLAQHLGYRQEVLVGKPYTELLSEKKEVKAVFQKLWNDILNDHRGNGAIQLKIKTGETSAVSVSGNYVAEHGMVVLLHWIEESAKVKAA
jgi:methyl-accepting chemotaxis protein